MRNILKYPILVFYIFFYFKILIAQEKKWQISINWEESLIKSKVEVPFREDISIDSYMKLNNFIKEEILKRTSPYLENLFLDSKYKLSDLLSQNKIFAQKYLTFLESLKVSSLSLSSEKIKAEMNIPLRGEKSLINQITLAWNIYRYETLKEAEYVGTAYFKNKAKREYQKSASPRAYTGLVVDLREFDYSPSLIPRIFSQEGKLIFGPEFLYRRIAIKRGLVGFTKSIKNKELESRTGKNPLFTTAINLKGRYQNDVVISNKDTMRLFDSPETIKNLLRCRVVFLVKNI